MNKKELIDKLISGKEFLKSDRIYKMDINFIIKILNMPEWNDVKFQGLLTSNIWCSNYENIQKILNMPEWNDVKFQGLLTSNIWCSNYET